MLFRTVFIAFMVAWSATGCGGLTDRGQPPAAGLPQLSIPALDELAAKRPAGALGNVRLGSQYFGEDSVFPHIRVEGDSLLFKPGPTPRDYAYVMYMFSADQPWESLWLETVWQIPPALTPRTNLWFGLFDYSEEKFEWFGRDSLGGMYIGDATNYAFCWTDGKFYLPVYVVVTGTANAMLDELRLLDSADDLTWEIETADPNTLWCRYMAMELNAADEPRVFYEVEQAGNFYAERNSGAWTIETIYSGHPAGKNCKLALDAAGNPHLAYSLSGEHTDTRVFYATRHGETWNKEVVVSRPSLRLGNLVLDSAGSPHLAFHDYSDASLNYAARSETGWLIDRIKGPCDHYAALSLTPDDIPQIAHRLNSMLWYAYFKDPTWWFTVVDDEPGCGLSPALAHDTLGRINLVYFSLQSEPAQLRHAFWDGETSSISPIAEIKGGVSNSVVVLRLDSQDCPQIAYSEYGWAQFGLSCLRYARFTDTEWQVETVYEGLEYDESFGFDLDSQDLPHFCFSAYFALDEQGICLYYARPR